MDTAGKHAAFHAAMPGMRAHAGTWAGRYTHLDARHEVMDAQDSRVVCDFPDDGPHAYIQRNTFTHADGRVERSVLSGTFRDGRLWWDEPSFHGSAWEAGDGVILLHLHRRDMPGTTFYEIILPPVGDRRSRTWHFVRDSTLVRRTLCEERRI